MIAMRGADVMTGVATGIEVVQEAQTLVTQNLLTLDPALTHLTCRGAIGIATLATTGIGHEIGTEMRMYTGRLVEIDQESVGDLGIEML